MIVRISVSQGSHLALSHYRYIIVHISPFATFFRPSSCPGQLQMKLWARPVFYDITTRARLPSTAAAGQDSGGKHPQGAVEGPIDGRILSAVLTTKLVVVRYNFHGSFTPTVREVRSQRNRKIFSVGGTAHGTLGLHAWVMITRSQG